MIYISGDTHGNFRRFESAYFPQQSNMSRKDYVIICGDFGIWEETPESNRWLDWLESKPFTTLFIDGNHDNHDLLKRFPQKLWNGGKVRQVREHLLHLLRGQVFTIEGITFFTMGGGASHDISDGILEPDASDFLRRKRMLDRRHAMYRVNHISWWAEEMPSDAEYAEAEANLEKAHWSVNCILTHCAPTSIVKKISQSYQADRLTDFLDDVMRRCQFGFWFFGHYHENRVIDEKFVLQWEQIVGLDFS